MLHVEDSATGKHGARIGGIGVTTTVHYTGKIFLMPLSFYKIMMKTQVPPYWNCVNPQMLTGEQCRQETVNQRVLATVARKHLRKSSQPDIKVRYI
jgi:hypothetical protein